MSATALLVYLLWRVLFTLPPSGFNLVAALALITFEAVPLVGLVFRIITLWNIDTFGPDPVDEARPGARAAVFIPTYNEPVEVIAPTIAAACALQPAHQTWVLDDGDRPWVREMCASYGARYVRRDEHTHAKAGNMNHALGLLQREVAAGADPVEVIGVLDCDHVPLPTFLTDTLGWFDDPQLALVQAPQSYYNAGAFDDDGETGEQGVFFHVLLPARNHDGAGPFWCGSTSLIRTEALAAVGGVSTDTIVEDMHTTLNLLRSGWKTAYHHQVLAVGLAPATPDQYLLQRRRWGMGSMQVLVKERLWAAKGWLSWRNYYEYLSGTLWWLEGVGTVVGFLIPAVILVSGAQTSTASPLAFTAAFVAMFSVRMWGVKRLFRMHMHWRMAFALRILRVPVGLSCLWWLLTRRTLEFEVTPKAGADGRSLGRIPGVLWVLVGLTGFVLGYGALGLTDWVPWQVSASATVASGVWLVLAIVVLGLGVRRIRDAAYATSRRNAYRAPVSAPVSLNGSSGELVDVSVGGAAVRLPRGALPPGTSSVTLQLSGAPELTLEVVRLQPGEEMDDVSLRVAPGDWRTYRVLALWLFHTPSGTVDGLPSHVPAVAAMEPGHHRSTLPVLLRQQGSEPAVTGASALAPAPQHSRRWPHAWWVLLAVGAPLMLAYELLDDELTRGLLYVVCGLVGVTGVLLGVRVHRPTRRGAWFALAASQALWVLGDITGTVQAALAPTEAFPTLADVGYLAGYPLLALSLYLLTRGRRPRRDLQSALDTLTVTVGLYLLCWVLLARPIFAEYQDSWLAAVLGAAYPLLDLGIIAMLVALVVTPGTHTGSLRLLCIAVALVMVGDTAVSALGLLSFDSTYRIDFIWLLSYLLVGAAALHPSIYGLSAPAAAGRPRLTGRRQIATALAVLVAPGTLAAEHVLGVAMDIWAVVLASVVMSLLVVARMNLVVHQIVAANDNRDRAQRELAHEAAHDSLTGLANRAQALTLISGSLSRAQRSGAMVGLLFVDLDGFKAVNDTYGHRAGDEVLCAVALRMQEAIRNGDLVGRLGGDEFVVLLEPVVDEVSAVVVAERLVAEVARPVILSSGQQVSVGASVGVAISQDGQQDPDALLVEADIAAYRAKERGKGRTEVFGAALRRELQVRAELEAELGAALAQEQLLLRYRPIIDLASGQAVGYEAVAYWLRQEVGLVPVRGFGLAVEASDLIFELDAWVLRRTAAQIAEWARKGYTSGPVGVRVSVRHTGRARLLDDVRRAIAEAGIEPGRVAVQVSDLQLGDDPVSLDHLAQLRASGMTVSLDDFGVGLSSVRRLPSLPVNAVKLDASLVAATAPEAVGLLSLMVHGAQNFGLGVIAKGVQEEQQVVTLLSIGCTLGQGDLFGSPLDADQVVGMAAVTSRR